MMKKVLIFVFVCIMCLLSACQDDRIKGIQQTEDVIDFGNEFWNDGDLDQIVTGIELEIDKDLALEIGDAVLRSHLGEKVEDMKLAISFISNKDIYVVSKIPKLEESEGLTGGDYSVAISKKDGRILKIWPGE